MELSVAQFGVVSNMFSFTIATMGAAALFFFLSRNSVAPKYRPALMVSGLVVSIACYHYFRIYDSWHQAYALTGDLFKATAVSFNDAYRYADWILTVPLLMVELIAVLALPKADGRSLLTKLVIAAALMIALGYPGEISSDPTTRWTFWGLSMVPFVYLLSVLFTQLTASLKTQPEGVRGLVSLARVVLLVTWSFYPIAYAIITVTGKTPAGQVALQLGYTIADITSKAGYGLLIYFMARAKSESEGYSPDHVDSSPRMASATGLNRSDSTPAWPRGGHARVVRCSPDGRTASNPSRMRGASRPIDDRSPSVPTATPDTPTSKGWWLSRLYDRLDRWRKGQGVRNSLATSLIAVFVGSLVLVEARRQGWLPQSLAKYVSTSHFVAIGIAFYLLVLEEVVGLIFSLADSVARSVGKQVEILSLILLRQSFEILSGFVEPMRWDVVFGKVNDSRLLDLIADALASLLVFVLVGYYYRIQYQQPI